MSLDFWSYDEGASLEAYRTIPKKRRFFSKVSILEFAPKEIMALAGKLSQRSIDEQELMDDWSVQGDELKDSLRWLTYVNKWLGGYEASHRSIRSLFRVQKELTIIDVGTGIADYPVKFVKLAEDHGCSLRVRAMDANEHALSYAADYVDDQLPPYLRGRITLESADAIEFPYETDSIDIVHAASFLHHFDDAAAVSLLREFQRVARLGVIINDLHRHALAYYGIKTIGVVTGAPRMFKHDGQLSVRRGFTRDEMSDLAVQAGLDAYEITWKWAFRWVLSSFRAGRAYA